MKYKNMTTKKLQALVSTVSDEDKKAIETILAERTALAEGPAAPDTTNYEDPDMTDEERAALAEAEKNGGVNPLYKPGRKKAMPSDEERAKMLENAKAVVFHRCEAMPFNSAEWASGYIAGVINDKRSAKILLAIKLDDGRRIVKVFGSPFTKVLDEVVEKSKAKRKINREPWTVEETAEALKPVIENVGKRVIFSDNTGGYIKTIVPVRRSRHLLYAIELFTPTDENPDATKIIHRTLNAKGMTIAAEFDERGAAINAAYIKRRNAEPKNKVSAEDKFVAIEAALKALEAKREKLEKLREKLREKLGAGSEENAAEAENLA